MCGFPTTCLEIQLLALVGLDVVVSGNKYLLCQNYPTSESQYYVVIRPKNITSVIMLLIQMNIWKDIWRQAG